MRLLLLVPVCRPVVRPKQWWRTRHVRAALFLTSLAMRLLERYAANTDNPPPDLPDAADNLEAAVVLLGRALK